MHRIKYIFFSLVIIFIMLITYIVTYFLVEPKVYDSMTKLFVVNKVDIDINGKKIIDKNKRINGSDDIILIVIDDKTAAKYRWPWKRELFCKIFDYLNDYSNPRVVVHDSVFSTPDLSNPESDRKFFDSLKKQKKLVEGFIINTEKWEDESFGEEYDKKFAQKFAVKNLELNSSIYSLFNSVIPFPEPYFNTVDNIGSVATIYGYIDGNFYADEIIRTIDYWFLYKNNVYPSLAMQTFLVANDFPKTIINDNYIEFPELNYKIKQNKIFWRWFVPLRFYKSIDGYSHKKVSAVDVMDSFDNIKNGKKPLIPPEVFENKIVVIGANVPASEGLVDMKHSALMSNHPGVDIQATAIDNLISNDFLKIMPLWANVLIAILGMLFVYVIIRTQEITKALFSCILLIFLYFVLCSVCFYNLVVINVMTPIIMAILTIIIAYIHRYIIENQNKKKVENIMGKYMSEDVMRNLIQNIDNLGLGGKKSNVTVLFSDIRGFTSISENMEAENVTQILNEYFSAMEPIVRKYNGIINKFIGDAIMAIFGEPIFDENHSKNAVKCGYEMLLKVEELQKKWKREGKPEIKIGIGINTGEVFIGNIGSENRMEYTVIGDTVNLASRLESYNKVYKTNMLISQSTFDSAKEIVETRKIPDVEIRGKANKIDIYEVIKVNNLN